MPPKRKAASKKKQRQRNKSSMARGGSGAAEAPNQCPAVAEKLPLAGVSDLDDDERIRKWIGDGGGKIDAKRLAKRMPNTVQDLREGKCSTEELASTLKDVYLESMSPAEDVGGADIWLLPPAQVCYRLSYYGWPGFKYEESKFNPNIVAMIKEFEANILTNLASAAQAYSRRTGRKSVCMASLAQQAFEITCRSWERRLDKKYYNSARGTFLSTCPLYGLSNDEFAAKASSINKVMGQRNKGDIVKARSELAAVEIGRGADAVLKSCWNCGATVDNLKVCSGCSVAHYCGHQCQRAARADGHKEICKKHGEIYANFKENMDTINRAHEVGTTNGMRPNHRIDCEVAYSVLISSCGQAEDMKSKGVNGPSMEIFYKNISMINRREWWIFDNPDTSEDYAAKLSSTKDGWMVDVARICKSLCYDIHEFISRHPFFDRVDSAAIEAMLGPDSAVLETKTQLGATMPAEFFLSYYGAGDDADFSHNDTDKKRAKHAEHMLLKALHDLHHK